MNYRLYTFLAIFLFVANNICFAQSLEVASFVLAPTQYGGDFVKDINNRPCALIKVQIVNKNVSFEGDIRKCEEKGQNEWWVWIWEGAKYLSIKSESFLPLKVTFAEHDIKLAGHQTYILRLVQSMRDPGLEGPTPSTTASNLNNSGVLPHNTFNKGVSLQDSEYHQKKQKDQNKYIAWGIVGTGHPWNLVSGIEYRGGGIVGFGLYGDIGMDFTRITVSNGHNYAHCTKTTFRYNGGLKFFPYRGLFLDCGYGSIAPATAEVKFDYIYLLDADDIIKIRKQVSTGHGPHIHIGYNLVTNLSKGSGFFLGINGGILYDVINKKTAPSFNLKIGVAWRR